MKDAGVTNADLGQVLLVGGSTRIPAVQDKVKQKMCIRDSLITVRGMRLLQKADVIIYAGSLVNPQLLDYAREGCEIY